MASKSKSGPTRGAHNGAKTARKGGNDLGVAGDRRRIETHTPSKADQTRGGKTGKAPADVARIVPNPNGIKATP